MFDEQISLLYYTKLIQAWKRTFKLVFLSKLLSSWVQRRHRNWLSREHIMEGILTLWKQLAVTLGYVYLSYDPEINYNSVYATVLTLFPSFSAVINEWEKKGHTFADFIISLWNVRLRKEKKTDNVIALFLCQVRLHCRDRRTINLSTKRQCECDSAIILKTAV